MAIIEKLQKNIIVFRYKKRDGSIRKAEGTLHPKYLPPAKSDKEFVRPEYQIVYYDLEKKSWRSFRSFEFVEILSSRPALSKREDDEEKKKLKAKEEEETKKVKKEDDVEKEVEKDEKVDEKEKDNEEGEQYERNCKFNSINGTYCYRSGIYCRTVTGFFKESL